MSKLVSLSDDAYGKLLKMKKGKESFSRVVLRLAEGKRKRSILRFAGIWKEDKEIGKTFNKIMNERRKFVYKEKDTSW